MSEETIRSTKKTPRKRAKGLALCLSGGGYRAALFHLGVLRAFHKAGILANVETVSSVSGGSIFSAFLAMRKRANANITGLQFDDWERDIAAPFRKLMTRDVRTGPILKHLLWNWALPNVRFNNLKNNLTKLYSAELGGGDDFTLGNLPVSPNFVFCASDLVHGVNWEFSRARVGSYCSGHVSIPQLEVALAVASSASFPPVFGPYTFDFTKYRQNITDEKGVYLKKMMLSDGGVYDNLGFEPVLKSHSEIFISDGGKPFGYSTSTLPWSRYTRFFPVMINQVADLRRRQYFTDHSAKRFTGSMVTIDGESRACNRKKPATERVTDKTGYGDTEIGLITAIRTDLDRFSDSESRIIENHGYCLMAARLLSKHPARIPVGVTLSEPPHIELMDASRVRQALGNSHRRFSVKRLLKRT